MDVSAWVSLGSAVASAVAAVGGGLYTRSQARTAKAAIIEAKRSAIADIRSSYAALDSARSDREAVALARATFDREDRPDFESSVAHGTEDAIGVTLKAVTDRLESRSTLCGPRTARVPMGSRAGRLGEPFGFPVKIDPRADEGTITLDLFCRDAADNARGWECPVVLNWDRRPPNLW